MMRKTCDARPNWVDISERLGFSYHTHYAQGNPTGYWREGAYYQLSMQEAEILGRVAYTLHSLAVNAVGVVLSDSRLLSRYLLAENLPDFVGGFLVNSWQNGTPGLVSKVRLAWNPSSTTNNMPVLLGYNADSPLGMVEQSAQEVWGNMLFPGVTQFAALDTELTKEFIRRRTSFPHLHVAYPREDKTRELVQNAAWYTDKAHDAGINVVPTLWDALVVDKKRQIWVDHQNLHVSSCYHPVPFSSLLREEKHARLLCNVETVQWVEPAWRSVMSSRLLLPILHVLNPNQRNILPATTENPERISRPIRYPVVPKNEGGSETFIYQQQAEFAYFGDKNQYAAEFEIWLVAGEPAALAVKEYEFTSQSVNVRFVPHIIV